MTACTRGPRARKIAQSARDHRYRRIHSGLPCAVVYGLLRALPGEPAFATVIGAMRFPHLANLAPASARQDHTTWPSAMVPLVDRHIRVHRIPASRVVTIAIRPSAIEAGCKELIIDF